MRTATELTSLLQQHRRQVKRCPHIDKHMTNYLRYIRRLSKQLTYSSLQEHDRGKTQTKDRTTRTSTA